MSDELQETLPPLSFGDVPRQEAEEHQGNVQITGFERKETEKGGFQLVVHYQFPLGEINPKKKQMRINILSKDWVTNPNYFKEVYPTLPRNAKDPNHVEGQLTQGSYDMNMTKLLRPLFEYAGCANIDINPSPNHPLLNKVIGLSAKKRQDKPDELNYTFYPAKLR